MKELEQKAIQMIRNSRARSYRASLTAIRIIAEYDHIASEKLRRDLTGVVRQTQIAFPRSQPPRTPTAPQQ